MPSYARRLASSCFRRGEHSVCDGTVVERSPWCRPHTHSGKSHMATITSPPPSVGQSTRRRMHACRRMYQERRWHSCQRMSLVSQQQHASSSTHRPNAHLKGQRGVVVYDNHALRNEPGRRHSQRSQRPRGSPQKRAHCRSLAAARRRRLRLSTQRRLDLYF